MERSFNKVFSKFEFDFAFAPCEEDHRLHWAAPLGALTTDSRPTKQRDPAADLDVGQLHCTNKAGGKTQFRFITGHIDQHLEHQI